ncbi:MAG: hypothetical protein WC717_02585 [Candidatus Micrarchaeia archaeon]
MVAKKRKAPASKPKKAASPRIAPSLKKPVSLYYPKPDEMRGRVRVEPPKIPPHAEPIDIAPTHEMKASGKKKTVPYAATAIGASAVLSGSLAAFFYLALGLDLLFSAGLALTFFIGLSILFYEFLELSERAGTN